MKRQILKFLRDSDAATAVEYAVMLGLILLATLASITAVGTRSAEVWDGNQQSIGTALTGAS